MCPDRSVTHVPGCTVRDPARTLPRAILVGVAIVTAAYLAINLGYLRVLGVEGLAADRQFAGEFARRTLGSTGGEILRAAMGISALGVCVVTILTSPWLFVAMAREGLFFRRFERLSPRTGAPVAALLVQLGLALGYWLWGEAGQIVDAVVFVEWIFHGLVAVAFLRLRARPGSCGRSVPRWASGRPGSTSRRRSPWSPATWAATPCRSAARCCWSAPWPTCRGGGWRTADPGRDPWRARGDRADSAWIPARSTCDPKDPPVGRELAPSVGGSVGR
jgi:amino acid transporter